MPAERVTPPSVPIRHNKLLIQPVDKFLKCYQQSIKQENLQSLCALHVPWHHNHLEMYSILGRPLASGAPISELERKTVQLCSSFHSKNVVSCGSPNTTSDAIDIMAEAHHPSSLRRSKVSTVSSFISTLKCSIQKIHLRYIGSSSRNFTTEILDLGPSLLSRQAPLFWQTSRLSAPLGLRRSACGVADLIRPRRPAGFA